MASDSVRFRVAAGAALHRAFRARTADAGRPFPSGRPSGRGAERRDLGHSGCARQVPGRGAGVRLARRSGGGRRRSGAQTRTELDAGLDSPVRARQRARLDTRSDRPAPDPLDQPRGPSGQRAGSCGNRRVVSRPVGADALSFAPMEGCGTGSAALRGADRSDPCEPRTFRVRGARRTCRGGAGTGMHGRDRRQGRHRHAEPGGAPRDLHAADLGRADDRAGRDGGAARTSFRDRADCADPAVPAAGRRRARTVSRRRARHGGASRSGAGGVGRSRSAGQRTGDGLSADVRGPHHGHHRRRRSAARARGQVGPRIDTGVRDDLGAPSGHRELRFGRARSGRTGCAPGGRRPLTPPCRWRAIRRAGWAKDRATCWPTARM